MPRKAKVADKVEGGRESAYLRRAKPVNVRRGPAAWALLIGRWGGLGLVAFGLVFAVWHTVDSYVEASPSFRFGGSERSLQVTGLRFVDRSDVQRVFEADRGQSMGTVPIEERRTMLLEIPWVEEARVLRVWPNRVWVHIEERKPVAWVRTKGAADFASLRVVDPFGVFLDPPADFDLELPVVSGLNEGMPSGERQVRVGLVQNLMADLGAERAKVSEIDVADSSNARVLTLYEGDVVELQMGAAQFRHRWEVFHKYVESWKEKYGRIGSVDLRFEGQVAVRRVDS